MIEAGPFPANGGEVRVNLGAETHLPWHEISICVVDAAGNPINAPVTGTITATALGIGANVPTPFEEELDLAANDRRWRPFMSALSDVFLTSVGMPAGLFFTVTIVNHTN